MRRPDAEAGTTHARGSGRVRTLAADRSVGLVVQKARVDLLSGQDGGGVPRLGRGERDHERQSQHGIARGVACVVALHQQVGEEDVLVEQACGARR